MSSIEKKKQIIQQAHTDITHHQPMKRSILQKLTADEDDLVFTTNLTATTNTGMGDIRFK